MSDKSLGPITQLLAAAERGDSGAHERLWAAVYRELHGLAQHQMAAESPAADVPSLIEMVRAEMTTALELDVPLEIDLSAGDNWLETETI